MQKEIIDFATAAVVTVGDGRGFVVEVNNKYFPYPVRLITTAAHCLPEMPPAITAMYLNEKTFTNLLGPLGEKPSVTAECLFYDPVSDLAVLGPPDDQELSEHFDAYEDFTELLTPVPMADTEASGEAWLLSLENVWFRGRFERINMGPLWLTEFEGKILGGMSGSPVLNSAGAAIGVVNLGDNNPSAASDDPQTALYRNLPGFMLWT
jgi:hypothetical protein